MDIRDETEINLPDLQIVFLEDVALLFVKTDAKPFVASDCSVDLLHRSVNLAPAFAVAGVCAWSPARSQIFPDASAVRPHGTNTDNSVWPCPPGRIPEPKRFCVKRFGVS